MSNKKEYNLDTLEVLKTEINKLKEARKKILPLDTLLLQQQKDIIELIKSGCNAKEITKVFQAAQIKVGVAKVKQLYFSKRISKSKPKVRENRVILPKNNLKEPS